MVRDYSEMKTTLKARWTEPPLFGQGQKRRNKGFGERDLSQGFVLSSSHATSSNHAGSFSETLDRKKREHGDEIAVCLKGKVRTRECLLLHIVYFENKSIERFTYDNKSK